MKKKHLYEHIQVTIAYESNDLFQCSWLFLVIDIAIDLDFDVEFWESLASINLDYCSQNEQSNSQFSNLTRVIHQH